MTITKKKESSFLIDIKNSDLYRLAYENSLDLCRIVNLEGKIIMCNNTYAKNLGYEFDEIIGTSIFEYVVEESFDDLKTTFETWKNTGQVRNIEIGLKRKDGSKLSVLLNTNNLYDEKGNLVGSNSSLRDISEIKEIKSEIDELKSKRLAIIGELSARIAHDLRNPLAVIKTSIQLLESFEDPAMKKYDEIFQKVENAIVRMSHQIEEVMDYVKPKSLRLGRNSLREIIISVIQKTPKKNVTIFAPKNDLKIICDEEKLEIVLLNLILNAIQAMENRGIIKIRIIDSDSYANIEIEDSGPGISNELKDKIFEPLFTTRQIGTGLGLPSCKGIIERHGGTISFSSKMGRGTIFSLSLPKN